MFKYFFILALGLALGYGYGWRDAQKNSRHIAERVLERIGGDSRALVSADIDKKMSDADKR
jgi:hypothetical protein